MHKEQNAKLPILESIRTLNSYGLEVTSGIILGLDTDTPTPPSADRVHRGVADPDADDQPPAGAAEDAAVGPPRRATAASSTTRSSNRTSASFAPMMTSSPRGGAASRMPMRRSGCSRASGTRSMRPTSTASSPGARQADLRQPADGRRARLARRRPASACSRTIAAILAGGRACAQRGQIDAVMGMGFVAIT